MFPLTPILRFQSATFFLNWSIAKKSNTLYSTMVANAHIKFRPRLDENCRRNSIIEFQAQYGPVLTKLLSAVNLIFGRSPKSNALYSPPITILSMKFG